MILFLLISVIIFPTVILSHVNIYENATIDEYDLSGILDRTREKKLISFNKYEENEVKVKNIIPKNYIHFKYI